MLIMKEITWELLVSVEMLDFNAKSMEVLWFYIFGPIQNGEMQNISLGIAVLIDI